MKMVLIVFGSLILFLSCAKSNDSATTPGTDTVPGGTLIATGNFTSGVHSTSGTAKVYNDGGTKRLRLENFKTDNGPDLKVYLSKDINAATFINISNLRSINGNQNYDISGMPDLAQYKYVLIWCQQFGVLFGSALVQ